MNIALVGPSPVPFTIGGVENVLWGLCDCINQNTSHQVELIKIPSRENDFWSLLETYESFYRLDLSHFDMVITTKYPAWMVRHKNHVCYMHHRLRGLYDTYHFMNLPVQTKRGCSEIDDILDYMAQNKDIEDLDEFFSKIHNLRFKTKEIPEEYFSFPGSFIREIIHFLDDNALSKKHIKAYYCISNTVKKRGEYFPKNCTVTTIYPPSNLQHYSYGDYKYVFMVSRLDSPKRIDLLIEAMKYVKSSVDLYIAGTGPQEQALKKMASGDSRIHFLGFVNDEDVEAYYRDSLVIPYFPYDEDYGLITVEAMMHKKPVITTIDAGGPTEFVVSGETGFVVALDAKAIAEKIDYFAQQPEEARRMGETAYQKVNKISWTNVVNNLLGGPAVLNKQKKKIVVTSTFPIYPPQGGGQARIYNIYKNLAKYFEVQILSIANNVNDSFEGYIANQLYETRIVKTEKHTSEEWNLEKKLGMSVTDIAMLTLIKYTPEYLNALRVAIDSADLVVLSHPYMWTAVKKFLGKKRFIYEAHNVEYNMKKEMLPTNKTAREQLEILFQAEKECCEQSEFIMACSEEDKVELARLYNVPIDKIIIVPNGVDTTQTTFISIEERLNKKYLAGLEKEKLGLFMGSWHGPNLEACEKIFAIAEQCPDTKFLLMGSQCLYFKDKKLPVNVGLLGVVDDKTKNRVFGLVDFALNPMLSGSGTNLKMFDYMAAGIPIITTPFGTRGIENKDVFMVAETEQMASAVNNFELKSKKQLVEVARKYVEETFDWKVIVESLLEQISMFN